jgi:hypothetical protein
MIDFPDDFKSLLVVALVYQKLYGVLSQDKKQSRDRDALEDPRQTEDYTPKFGLFTLLLSVRETYAHQDGH